LNIRDGSDFFCEELSNINKIHLYIDQSV